MGISSEIGTTILSTLSNLPSLTYYLFDRASRPLKMIPPSSRLDSILRRSDIPRAICSYAAGGNVPDRGCLAWLQVQEGGVPGDFQRTVSHTPYLATQKQH